MAQTTPSSFDRSLDQFYTRPDTAETCLALLAARLPDLSPDLYVEPAAGDGAFFERLPQPRFGLDIAPSAPGVETGDFLQWIPDEGHETIAVVGNPPFGRNAAKAIAFFNHASRFAEVIAMILPASLMKGTMQDRLDPNFHLVDELPLPAEPFRVGEKLRPVNTVFQIWRREPSPRGKTVRKTGHADFDFVATAAEADFIIRRVGARAGTILPSPGSGAGTPGYSPSSNHFIKAVDLDPAVLVARFGKLDFGEIRQCAVAHPSVSKSDIVALYEAQLNLERIAEASTQGTLACCTAPYTTQFSLLEEANEGDLVAMIVHHGARDAGGTMPPLAVEFRWRHESSFEPVLHTALRGKRRRRAMQLLEDLFARRMPLDCLGDTRRATSILFRDAILRMGPPGKAGSTMKIEMMASFECHKRRMARAAQYRALALSWISVIRPVEVNALVVGAN